MNIPDAAPVRPGLPLLPGLLAALCVALPWLDPIAGGPSPAVQPLLASLACAAVLIPVLAWTRGLALPGDWARFIAWAWLAAALASAAIGLLQYFGLATHLQPWVSPAEAGLAYGNLRQRNQLATLMAMGLVALAYLAQAGRVRAWAGWPAMALLLAAAAATASRTGLAQLLLLLAMACAWPGLARGLRRSALAVLPMYLALSWLLPRLLPAAGRDAAPDVLARIGAAHVDCNSRLTLWSNVLELIERRPWTGWGWGELDFAHFITPYPGPRFCEILDNAHNLPLHLAVELGVPLAAIACAALAWGLWRLRPWRAQAPERQMAWTVLALIGLHSLLEYPLWYGPFQMAALLCALLLWRGKAASAPQSQVFALGMSTLGLALLTASAWAAWDYHRVSQLYLDIAARDATYRSDTYRKVGGSWLFRNQVLFAELTTTPLAAANAARQHELALRLLHYSPEPRVIEKAIDSARMLGLDEEAAMYAQRYQAAFPKSHAQWLGNGRPS